MSQINLITKTIKKLLKANNLHYEDVAKALGLPQPNVKRLFAENNFTLERLKKICHLMNIELNDIFQKLKSTKTIGQLTVQDESTIVNDIKLLLIATSVINNWSLSDMWEVYDINYPDCIQKLSILDKMNIIELQPKNKIILKISPNFSRLPNGLIKKFFDEYLQYDFLQSSFCKKKEFFNFRFGMLTEESRIILCRKLQNIADKFIELAQEDMHKDAKKRQRSGLLLCFRPWIPQLFDQFKK